MTQNKVLNDRYEVLSLIGRGGMADVYRARDIRLGREVAIKLLRRDMARDPVFQARFRREAQAVAGLNHPAIVAVYDTGDEQVPDDRGNEGTSSVPFIVMEYVDGRTLRDLLKDGEVSVDDAVDYTLGVLSALTYSHSKSIVHRDIKPANVMVADNGRVMVMDFGIARALADASATMTQTQAVVGTAQYLSPEQARGETVDVRSDIYSTGCLLFELLTGRPPFVGDSPVAVAYQHVGEAAPSPSALNENVPRALDTVIARALQKDREDRYPDAAAFAAALEQARRGGDPEATQLHPAVVGHDDARTEALAVSSAATAAIPASSAAGPAHREAHAATPEDGEDHHAGALTYDDGSHLGGAPGHRGEDRRRGRGWAVFATVLVILVLAGGAAYLWNWSQQVQAANAQVSVPAVAGLDPTTAQNRLIDADLRVRGIVEEFSDDVDEGLVVGTRPGSGESVRVDSPVELVVSKGPESVEIPDLGGATESTARASLEDLGLVVDTEMREENSATVPQDRVLSTNPGFGERVQAGSTVQLTLSTGRVSVPDLMAEGLTVEEADALVSDPAVGLSLRVVEETNAVLPPGTITGQSPEAGADIEQGGVVQITVATEPAAPAEPTPSEESESPSPSESAEESSEPAEESSEAPGNSDQAPGRSEAPGQTKRPDEG
ncbi:Stk1 family PASTA domain-containing Ser/Thr kinase [Zhihengliuella sp.]|uniref:Stk1 family PASTA domain-containing Ser/Thr kinase n=1 Tax=Zhihengliuella sp. TaxID=1954483 RepID=UPI002811D0E1|nr:Stk1 family PASTA domain-containing Ser/Thr kinase [Zhihengliuella sp.]